MLGTLEVSHDGRAVEVRGPLPRRLLAVLALTPGREVSGDQLVEALWGESPPPAAPATLQSHVARLRRDLPVADVVRTGRHGYLLDVAEEDVDALVLERQVSEGGKALLQGRLDDASRILGQALELWRGAPYGEFAGCAPLEAEADRLSHLRLDALERRITADLGRPGVAPPVAELEALVRWHPMRESFWALLMGAQYRAGRQADALAAYQRARAVLSDELGVDPGPQLQEMERMVLAQDPSLDTVGVSQFLPQRRDERAYSDGVALVERASLVESLQGLHEEALSGSGRLVLLHGETGAGKSALVREWSVSAAERAPVLWGACDPLSSPRALGPLVDVAPLLDSTVAEMLRSGERDGLFEATLAALASGPAVLVIEDLHWADASTYDFVRFVARRIDRTCLLVVVTYRDENLEPSDPLRVMLGDIASLGGVRRLGVPLLSEAAVAELATGSGIDAADLHAETGGNAFFVTEVLASGGEHLPSSVQEAVLSRVHRLSPQARLALQAAAVIGARIEPSLVHALPDVPAEGIDECVTSGMLRYDAPTYGFRHELVRQAVLSGITPGRLGALHWQVLDRLRTLPIVPRPLARLADHAAQAGDGPAVLEFAIAAGDLAASLGSHREAAFQYGRALPYAELLDEEARIGLLGKRAYECQVADDHEHAIEAWNQQLELLRPAGRTLEAVDALLGLDQSYYTIGDNSPGHLVDRRGFALLEGTGPSPHLARTLRYRGAHHLRASENAEAIVWLEEALDMSRDVGARDVEARALASLGMTHLLTRRVAARRRGDARGTADRLGHRGRGHGRQHLPVGRLDPLAAVRLPGGARPDGGGGALHRRSRPPRSPDVRACERDHDEARPRSVGRGDGRGARPALRAQHRASQPDRAADGDRTAGRAARRSR